MHALPHPARAADAAHHQLQRFVDAQAPVYAAVVQELSAARKRSHWMWFVFPQLRGLGRSAMALHFGLAGHAEALAYWRHPTLGARLAHCTQLVLAAPVGCTALDIFGTPDDIKLRSCITLFETVAGGEPCFGAVVERYFGGNRDAATLALLAPPPVG